MTIERMSPLDASFLHVEDRVSHMHIGSVAVFEGPEPPFVRVMAMIRSKLALVPRYRQVVRRVPLQLGRPVWIDDVHFDLDYHVRHTALPSPGGDDELRNLVGRVMSQQLDRTRPLWEIWVVQGLRGGRWALLSKTHHCMVDGVSGTGRAHPGARRHRRCRGGAAGIVAAAARTQLPRPRRAIPATS